MDNLHLVNYFSAPNFVTSCGKHATGKHYRVFPEFVKDENFEQYFKDFFTAIGAGHIHKGLSSLRGHFLDGIVKTFNSTTGKPDKYEQILDWPEIIVDEAKLNTMKNIIKNLISFIPFIKNIPFFSNWAASKINRLNSEYTLNSLIEILGNVLNGNIKSKQFWEVFKHLDGETYHVKANLDPSKEFNLKYIAHYKTTTAFDHGFLDGRLSTNDKLIKKIGFKVKELMQSKKLSEFIKKQLENITSEYKIIIDNEHNYHIVTNDVNAIRNKIDRLIKAAPEILTVLHTLKTSQPHGQQKSNHSNYSNPEFDTQFTSNNGTKKVLNCGSNFVKGLTNYNHKFFYEFGSAYKFSDHKGTLYANAAICKENYFIAKDESCNMVTEMYGHPGYLYAEHFDKKEIIRIEHECTIDQNKAWYQPIPANSATIRDTVQLLQENYLEKGSIKDHYFVLTEKGAKVAEIYGSPERFDIEYLKSFGEIYFIHDVTSNNVVTTHKGLPNANQKHTYEFGATFKFSDHKGIVYANAAVCEKNYFIAKNGLDHVVAEMYGHPGYLYAEYLDKQESIRIEHECTIDQNKAWYQPIPANSATIRDTVQLLQENYLEKGSIKDHYFVLTEKGAKVAEIYGSPEQFDIEYLKSFGEIYFVHDIA